MEGVGAIRQSSPVVVGTRLRHRQRRRPADHVLPGHADRPGLWRANRRERVQVAFKANDPASPTPAADESGVVASFLNLDWQRTTTTGRCVGPPARPVQELLRMAGSPIIDGGAVVWSATSRRSPLSWRSTARPGSAMEDRSIRHLDWVVDTHGLSTRTRLRGPDVLGTTRLTPTTRVRRPARWLRVASVARSATPLAHGAPDDLPPWQQ